VVRSKAQVRRRETPDGREAVGGLGCGVGSGDGDDDPSSYSLPPSLFIV